MLGALSEDSIPCSHISRANLGPTDDSPSQLSRVHRPPLIQLSGLGALVYGQTVMSPFLLHSP